MAVDHVRRDSYTEVHYIVKKNNVGRARNWPLLASDLSTEVTVEAGFTELPNQCSAAGSPKPFR